MKKRSGRTADSFAIWCVYDHPKDCPHAYLARKWLVVRGQEAPQYTDETIIQEDLPALRACLRTQGLIPLSRNEGDFDPTIMETWI